MVCVRLAREWVDNAGAGHAAGDMIDVDAGTLAELESKGIVAGPPEFVAEPKSSDGWANPDGSEHG